MFTNRRIDPAWYFVVRNDLVVQRIAHAVQALEFVTGAIRCHFQNGGGCVSVVRGKHRINAVAVFQQFTGTGLIGHVGRRLAAEYREVVVAFDLADLHFAVPIGAFNQAHHQLAADPDRQFTQPFNQRQTTFGISLNRQTKPFPAG